MTTDKFQAIKAEILSRAKEANACKEQYGRAYKSKTLAELMQVVKDNFSWACYNKVITPDLIEKYREEFAENDILLNVDVKSGYLLCDNSSVVARGNSSVVAWDNSSVVARGNSSVEAWDNSSVVARGNSSVEARDNSSVEARGNSSVVARDNSSVEAWDNSSVVACDNSYITSLYKIECKVSENAIYWVRSENTIYYASDNLKFVKQ